MSQSNPAEREPDPLLSFVEEAGSPDPIQPVEPAVNAPDPSPAPPIAADAAWHARVERAERQVERAHTDISALQSDLATLVSAVNDIKERMGRSPSKPVLVALPSRKLPARGGIAAAILIMLLMAAAAAAGLASFSADELPEPRPVENVTSSAAPPAPPPSDPQPEVSVAPPAPAPSDPQPDVGAAVQKPISPPAPAARARPAPSVNYFGTLTVEAEPAGEVFLNRQSVGHTPVRLENLRAGSHLIWIQREGHRRWTRVVAVTANRISRVSASLEPLSR